MVKKMNLKIISKKAGVFVVSMVMLSMIFSAIPISAETDIPTVYAPNQVIVKLNPGVSIGSLNLDSHYSVIESDDYLNAYLVTMTGKTEQQAIQEISSKPGVKFVELNQKVYASFEPNDPLWKYQYGPKNIKCPGAWDIQRGKHSVVVAVIDTGIDYTHPDLVNHYQAFGSWNFVAHNGDPLDDCGHGTHCAGIIAAEMNNGIGIAGIADVKIMAIKVLGADGSAFIWTVSRGIIRAGIMGADVISMSFGAEMLSIPLLLQFACNLSYNLGATLVAAAGNSGDSGIGWISYPAMFPNVIAVGATDGNNDRAYFSSYGPALDFMAPGVDIISTTPTYHASLNDPPYNFPMNYANLSGTSMATPHVAGVIALYLSKNGVRVSNEKIYQRLRDSVTDIGSPGFDDMTGYGLINATKLLQYNDALDSSPLLAKVTKITQNQMALSI